MKAYEASENLNDAHERGAKQVALLIAVLAALLAIIEVAGGNAEQDAQKSNVDAANLWSFYQAKTIRQTVLRAEADRLDFELPALSPERQEPARRLVAAWRADIARYESEPSTNEGRRELVVRAKAAEGLRDLSLAKDDMFDYASAAMQLAIVLASASVVVGIGWLAYVGAGVGFLGVLFAFLGFLAPTLLQL